MRVADAIEWLRQFPQNATVIEPLIVTHLGFEWEFGENPTSEDVERWKLERSNGTTSMRNLP